MYFLFAGCDYYPGGGVNDYVDSYRDLASAKTAGESILTNGCDWAQIVEVRGDKFKTVSRRRNDNRGVCYQDETAPPDDWVDE